MRYLIRSEKDLKKISTQSLMIGFFDAPHIGHKKLVKKCENELTILTFEFKKHPNYIYSTNNRIEAIDRAFKPKNIILWDLNSFNIDSKTFISYIKKYLDPREIIVGSDFRFGNDLNNVKELSNSFNVKIVKRNKFLSVSTTKIKKLLKNGKIARANRLMIQPYIYTDAIVKGEQIARKLGYKTANFLVSDESIIPKYGIYLSKAFFQNKEYFGLTFIGKPKTIGDLKHTKFETHLLNLNTKSDFYGEKLAIQLVKKIGNVKKFKSIDSLKKRINNQMKFAKKYFKI